MSVSAGPKAQNGTPDVNPMDGLGRTAMLSNSTLAHPELSV